ncbi:MAG: hypothetical protein IPL05_05415 [Betaproteobacteria bacterium]|nr:hypothetical protein [Betaproteobacteria bacterium]
MNRCRARRTSQRAAHRPRGGATEPGRERANRPRNHEQEQRATDRQLQESMNSSAADQQDQHHF